MKDRSIVLNIMAAKPGEVLERNRTHIVKKDESGKVVAQFRNQTQEDSAIKLTLTALEPYACFEILINGEVTGEKKANAAGILECRIMLPERRNLVVRQK